MQLVQVADGFRQGTKLVAVKLELGQVGEFADEIWQLFERVGRKVEVSEARQFAEEGG